MAHIQSELAAQIDSDFENARKALQNISLLKNIPKSWPIVQSDQKGLTYAYFKQVLQTNRRQRVIASHLNLIGGMLLPDTSGICGKILPVYLNTKPRKNTLG